MKHNHVMCSFQTNMHRKASTGHAQWLIEGLFLMFLNK